MPNTTSADDPWADLYADLGVTERPAVPVQQFEAAPESDDQNAEQADDEDGDEDAEGADGAPPELDEDGNPKKRKRRRRRRSKKKGEEAGPAPTLYEGNEPPMRAPVRVAAPVSEESELQSDDEDAEETVPVESALEGGTSEMTREMIANWNVPSWEEIVTGLYRPER